MRKSIAGCLLAVLATAALGTGPSSAQTMTAERFQDWYHYNNFGRDALNRGDLDAASKCFRQAIEFARPAVASDPQPLARSYTDLSMVLVRQGRADEAEPMAEWALGVRERRFGSDSVPAAQTLHVLALIASAQKRYPRAEALLGRSLAIWEKQLPPNDPRLAIYLNDLATLYSFQRKYAQAEPLFQQVLEFSPRDLPANHPDRAVSLIGLASLFAAQGEFDRAESFDRQLLALLAKMPSTSYTSIAGSLEPYLTQLRKLGRTAEADALEAQARSAREGKNAPDPGPIDPRQGPRRSRPS
jgi:tetratricopeptide (TPR) repeat protein